MRGNFLPRVFRVPRLGGEEMIDTECKRTRLIVIVGFMGSGKSTVARELGRLLNSPAIDLDELICKRAGRTPEEIIGQDGEGEFRRIETETLHNELAAPPDEMTWIISLGGGAWTVKTNRDLISLHEGFSVWLDAPFETCWRRIEANEGTRPLASSQEKARVLYVERRSLYELTTIHLAIPETETAQETARRIQTALK